MMSAACFPHPMQSGALLTPLDCGVLKIGAGIAGQLPKCLRERERQSEGRNLNEILNSMNPNEGRKEGTKAPKAEDRRPESRRQQGIPEVPQGSCCWLGQGSDAGLSQGSPASGASCPTS